MARYGDIVAIGVLDVRHLNQPGKIVVETPLASPSQLIAIGAGAGAALAAAGVVATRTVAIGDAALGVALAGSEDNVGVGHNALFGLTTGDRNLAGGTDALRTITVGADNVALGYRALRGAAGGEGTNRNVAVGAFALAAYASAGDDNVAVGYQAATLATGGTGSVHVGARAGAAVTTASRNVLVGVDVAPALTTGDRNVVIGPYVAGESVSATLPAADSTGYIVVAADNDGGPNGANLVVSDPILNNVHFGTGKPGNWLVASGINNVAIGARALDALTTGSRNVTLGSDALGAFTIGTDAVVVGYHADILATSAVGQVVIGSGAGAAHTDGDYNILCGFGVAPVLTTGEYNVVIGAFVAGTATKATLPAAGSSGYIVIAAHLESEVSQDQIVVVTPSNVFVGAQSPGNWLTSTGGNNTVVGRGAVNALTTGANNTVLGGGCGTSLTTGGGNILVGNDSHIADTPAVGTSDMLNIGGSIFGALADGDVRVGGAGVVTAGIRLQVIDDHNDTTPVFSLELTGANGTVIRSFVGTRNPDATISGDPGDIYYRKSGVDSTPFVNVGAAAANTDWRSLVSGGITSQTAIPIETDDSADGYRVGDRVYSTSARAWYTASDVTAGAAQWHRETSPAGRTIRLFEPAAGAIPTANMGWNTSGPVGTFSTPTTATTNRHTSMHRLRDTSAAGANSAASILLGTDGAGNAIVFLRGAAGGQGGFYLHFTFAVNTTVANQRFFLGLWASGAPFGGAQDPDALTNCFGVGWRSADGNLQVFHNDAAGTVTAVDLGASFPANDTTAVYEVILYAAPVEAEVHYVVRRLDSAAVAAGSPAANLPVDTTFMAAIFAGNNGGTASAIELDLMRVYAES